MSETLRKRLLLALVVGVCCSVLGRVFGELSGVWEPLRGPLAVAALLLGLGRLVAATIVAMSTAEEPSVPGPLMWVAFALAQYLYYLGIVSLASWWASRRRPKSQWKYSPRARRIAIRTGVVIGVVLLTMWAVSVRVTVTRLGNACDIGFGGGTLEIVVLTPRYWTDQEAGWFVSRDPPFLKFGFELPRIRTP